MEEKKKSPLQEWRENATEEELKEMYEKGARTRRKNKYEEKKIQQQLNDLLSQPLVFKDEEGKIKNTTRLEQITLNLIDTALEKGGKQVVAAFTAIRDSVGEKPTNKVDVDGTLGIESYLNPIESDEEW